MKTKIFLGKVNRNGTIRSSDGPRNCKAYLEFELKDDDKGPVFSATAEAWNNRGTDIFIGGQCLESLVPQFTGHPRAQRILAIWREYHLNDMNAGTPEQEAEIERRKAVEAPKHPECYYADGTVNCHHLASVLIGEMSFYTLACNWLKGAGLYEVQLNGKPYAYGSAWLYRHIPESVQAEIRAIAEHYSVAVCA